MHNDRKLFSCILWFTLSLLMGAFVILPAKVQAQMADDELWMHYEQRQAEHHEAGRVLLTWGAASLASGGLFLFTDIKDFGLMTAGWGAVNTAIAATSLLKPARINREESNISDILRYEQRYNRIIAINTGLNISYIAAGLGMAKYGTAQRTREYGAAILAQGAFLLIYDSVLLHLSSRYLDRVSLYPAYFNSGILNHPSGSGGITLNVQF